MRRAVVGPANECGSGSSTGTPPGRRRRVVAAPVRDERRRRRGWSSPIPRLHVGVVVKACRRCLVVVFFVVVVVASVLLLLAGGGGVDDDATSSKTTTNDGGDGSASSSSSARAKSRRLGGPPPEHIKAPTTTQLLHLEEYERSILRTHRNELDRFPISVGIDDVNVVGETTNSRDDWETIEHPAAEVIRIFEDGEDGDVKGEGGEEARAMRFRKACASVVVLGQAVNKESRRDQLVVCVAKSFWSSLV